MPDCETKVRVIAFYLPQFHPIPENNEWWGEGFTEWTNVVKARPLFRGHYQPHLPADLGFYDLRVPEVREAQADLAREYGISGFCYYHYWFEGKRPLKRPLDGMLASGKPDFPFCLCWANENWTRKWDGMDQEVLIEQKYSESDDLCHIEWLSEVFKDERYIRIDGRPLFLIYRISRLPDLVHRVRRWREFTEKALGQSVFLCNVESFSTENVDPARWGLDASVEFQPRWADIGPRMSAAIHQRIVWRILGKTNPFLANNVYSYHDAVSRMITLRRPQHLQFPCVMPSWDNSARRRNGAAIFLDSNPDDFKRWLRHILQLVNVRPQEKQIVFVNAWNEWAEGNHLEPCQRWGRGYLEAVREALVDYAAQ